MLVRDFLKDPETRLTAELEGTAHGPVYVWFCIAVLSVLLFGWRLSDGVFGLKLAVIYILLSMLVPFISHYAVDADKRGELRTTVPVFLAARAMIYAAHLFALIMLGIGLTEFAIVTEMVMLPVVILSNYLAVWITSGKDTRRAVRVTVFANACFMILVAALLALRTVGGFSPFLDLRW